MCIVNTVRPTSLYREYFTPSAYTRGTINSCSWRGVTRAPNTVIPTLLPDELRDRDARWYYSNFAIRVDTFFSLHKCVSCFNIGSISSKFRFNLSQWSLAKSYVPCRYCFVSLFNQRRFVHRSDLSRRFWSLLYHDTLYSVYLR